MRYCPYCHPEVEHQPGDVQDLCAEHDDDDLEEYEDKRRRRIAERNEY